MSEIVERLKQFMENEAGSCSMDFGCVTPEYVYRSWGGAVAIEDIKTAMAAIKQQSEPHQKMKLRLHRRERG